MKKHILAFIMAAALLLSSACTGGVQGDVNNPAQGGKDKTEHIELGYISCSNGYDPAYGDINVDISYAMPVIREPYAGKYKKLAEALSELGEQNRLEIGRAHV